MKLIRYIAAGLLAAGTSLALAAPASATEQPEPVASECATGWYVNPDETERKPEPTEAGFKFEASDLMHRAANLPLADLEPGSYVAAPAPDQPSFFSVEIRDAETNAYGTLRWNGTAWTLTTNVDTFTETDPADFVGVMTNWGEITEAAKVVSFGVGYTLNPPGTVATVVTEVSFAGTKYSLTCEAEESPSPQPETTPPATASPSPAALPLTPGASSTKLAVLGGIGGALLLAGAGAFLLARARRTRYTAE